MKHLAFNFFFVLLIAEGIFGQPAKSQDSKSVGTKKPVDIQALEQKLTTTIERIGKARFNAQDTSAIKLKLDRAFNDWHKRVAPVASRSAGWPNASAKAQRSRQGNGGSN